MNTYKTDKMTRQNTVVLPGCSEPVLIILDPAKKDLLEHPTLSHHAKHLLGFIRHQYLIPDNRIGEMAGYFAMEPKGIQNKMANDLFGCLVTNYSTLQHSSEDYVWKVNMMVDMLHRQIDPWYDLDNEKE